MNEGWTMQSKMNKKKKEILMNKGEDTLTFVEQKNNLFCLRARVVEEILVANYYYSAPAKETATPIIIDDEESDKRQQAIIQKSIMWIKLVISLQKVLVLLSL